MFRIGDFSRLARVSVKTLRHYDALGLLQPEHVDAASGYRYYSAAQVPRLQWILALRDLGVGLERIRECLDADEATIRRTLHEQREELMGEIAQGTERLRRLDALLRTTATPAGSCAVLRAIPDIPAYTIRDRVPTTGEPIQAMFEHAEAQVAKLGLRLDDSPFLLFHDSEFRDVDLDIEVCIPIKRLDDAPAAQARCVPGAPRAGTLTYRGTYEQTPELLASLAGWIEAGGYRIEGPLREVYHCFGADQRGYRLPGHRLAAGVHDYVTELQIPVNQEC